MEFFIRQELTHEYNTTEDIVKRAFLNEKYSDKKEHFLVNKIRKSDAFIPELSLVALNGKEIVGHILLSKIKIVDGDNAVDSLALAPVSVAPEYQRKGIGSQLIHVALKKAKELGYRSVIVLGHKDYYPKFGFKPASLWNIKAPFEVPDEVFMALELSKESLENVKGVVHYSKAFSV
ncbi:GNAT family N-acetyltransferase [Bacillus inaquosorum]|uniref:GNAT family acetyltransferase n=1 Tax=Bacillus inaquosorum KCTC 13429 TaxID=1236548 RepID=A0A9W5LIJ5_9BACI|nr:N-acetyltransferase [Bacillus inaquosorum]RKQ20524.1 N-acetyltransferase [Bacillus subtilis]AWM17072.1 N-acetyltransferase [Bacillus inaquosorum]ELS61423.1 GNAT family acetyltransferase [Bacillus inaquosorum KCTC 13429]MCY8998187.1 N-acetyltransferase [Bacillus inaquosorum]MCY9057837.1 N-acetyltransferase [Bacillus inaquosorum]